MIEKESSALRSPNNDQCDTCKQPPHECKTQSPRRYASQNSLILVLRDDVSILLNDPSDEETYMQIELIISNLLSDPEPNKKWILGLVHELRYYKDTVEFFWKLKEKIDKY